MIIRWIALSSLSTALHRDLKSTPSKIQARLYFQSQYPPSVRAIRFDKSVVALNLWGHDHEIPNAHSNNVFYDKMDNI
jgi:hypothetical protein